MKAILTWIIFAAFTIAQFSQSMILDIVDKDGTYLKRYSQSTKSDTAPISLKVSSNSNHKGSNLTS